MSRKKKILNPEARNCVRCGVTFTQNYGNYQRAVCAVCKDNLNYAYRKAEEELDAGDAYEE